MHIYAHGDHGFGVRPSERPVLRWPNLLGIWLRTINVVPKG